MYLSRLVVTEDQRRECSLVGARYCPHGVREGRESSTEAAGVVERVRVCVVLWLGGELGQCESAIQLVLLRMGRCNGSCRDCHCKCRHVKLPRLEGH